MFDLYNPDCLALLLKTVSSSIHEIKLVLLVPFMSRFRGGGGRVGGSPPPPPRKFQIFKFYIEKLPKLWIGPPGKLKYYSTPNPHPWKNCLALRMPFIEFLSKWINWVELNPLRSPSSYFPHPTNLYDPLTLVLCLIVTIQWNLKIVKIQKIETTKALDLKIFFIQVFFW